MPRSKPVEPERSPLPPDSNGLCYTDEQHFDQTIARIARDQLAGRARTFESALPWGLALLVIASLIVCAGYGGMAAIPVLLLTIPLLFILVRGESSVVRRIERERWCFNCAYPLLQIPPDAEGWATCPECGTRFHEAYYRRPPPMYRRNGDVECSDEHCTL